MRHVGFGKIACIGAVFCIVAAIASPAQTFTVLAELSPASGEIPNGPLVEGADGNFYGTAGLGGANHSEGSCNNGNQTGCGTVFKITPAGKLTTVYNFCSETNCADGAVPLAGLLLGTNGNFYGTTDAGGANDNENLCPAVGCGTFFEITPAGKLTTLYSFCAQANCADGVNPSKLVQATNGSFYGVTATGGIANIGAGCPDGCGTVFEITPAGKLTTLYNFCTQNGVCLDGEFPQSGLVQATNGNFYGITLYGGTSASTQCGSLRCGTVFEITPSGKLTTLHSFDGTDGEYAVGTLLQGNNGNLYGAAQGGSNNSPNCDFGCGTIYEITAAGKFTTFYNFCSVVNGSGSCIDGADPSAGIAQGSDGNFYGTTNIGGNSTAVLCANFGCGTAFELTPGGRLTTLYSFCSQASCDDGAFPGGLMQATNGTFYGLAAKGGRPGCVAGGGCGTAYSLSVGLGPFVEAIPNSGKAGRVIGILGNNLAGTTSVTFNGTSATFSVKSGTVIEAKVPTGATTGTIEVTTPAGTLSSNVAFNILP